MSPAVLSRTSTEPTNALRILLADDDAMLRLAVGGLLVTLGHEVVVARDGVEAVRRAREEEYAGSRRRSSPGRPRWRRSAVPGRRSTT